MKTLLQKLFGKTELYVSPLGRFIKKVDERKSAHSASQQKEIKYYEKLFALRDKAQHPTQDKTFWSDF